VILVFVGVKMVLAEVVPISTGLSLGIIAATLVIAVGSSILLPPPNTKIKA